MNVDEGVRAPVVFTLKALWHADRWRTVALSGCVGAGVALPTAFMVAAAALIDAVPAAVTGGLSSPGGERMLAALGWVAGLFAAQQVLEPLRETLGSALGRRLDTVLQQAVIQASVAPIGIGHLETAGFADDVAAARGVGSAFLRPGFAAASAAALATARLRGLVALAILASFRWWASAAVAAGWVLARRWLHREVATILKHLRASTPALRRAGYFRELALAAAPAKEVRVFRLGPLLLDRFTTAWRDGMGEVWRERAGRRAEMIRSLVLVAAVNGGLFVLIGRAGARGELDLGAVTLYTQAAFGAMAVGWTGDQEWYVPRAAAAAKRAFTLRERFVAVPSATSGRRTAEGLPAEGIGFSGLRFRYPGAEHDTLSGLDLWIPAGQSLAVVGANGAGKTTLIKLLARLLEPASGSIEVDGIDVTALDVTSWRRRLGIIFQDFVRYELPLRDNVAFGHPRNGGDALVRAALDRVGAAQLTDTLERGIETVLSPRYRGGTDLSGGQWQRVALARVVYAALGGAGVVVLDEPTANLDIRAEAELFDRFLDLTPGLTTILVSHRFSTVRRADRIVVLDAGRLVEDGSHDELMELDGRYAEMFRLQAARFGAA
jgi:ATP-binding cassette, subfamily B, bacterial